MKTIKFRLDEELALELTKRAKRIGCPKSELIRRALRRQLALVRFGELRRSVAPFVKAKGWLTDDDVFRNVS